MKDQNGRPLVRNVKQEPDKSWGCNVWFGHNPPTNLCRKFYLTREQARDADISDTTGNNRGCIGGGAYSEIGD